MELRFKLRHLRQAYGVNCGDPYCSFHFRFQFVKRHVKLIAPSQHVPAHLMIKQVPPLSTTAAS